MEVAAGIVPNRTLNSLSLSLLLLMALVFFNCFSTNSILTRKNKKVRKTRLEKAIFRKRVDTWTADYS